MSTTLYDFSSNSNTLLQTFTSSLLTLITFQRCKNNGIEAECASFGITVISGESHCPQHFLSFQLNEPDHPGKKGKRSRKGAVVAQHGFKAAQEMDKIRIDFHVTFMTQSVR